MTILSMRMVEPLFVCCEISPNGSSKKVSWGGKKVEIERNSPRRILDVKEKTLVPYDCGVMF